MSFLSFVLSFFLVTSQVFSQDLSKNERYWLEADLQISELSRYIRPQICSSDLQVYYGCYQAVATLNTFVNKNTSLTLKSNAKKPWESSVLKTFGLFEVRNIETSMIPKKRSIQETKEELASNEALRKEISSLYSDQKNSEEIVEILNWLSGQLPSDNKSLAIAKSIERFFIYGVDAHAHLHTLSEFRDMNNPEAQEPVVGIGAILTKPADVVDVIEVFPGSPASLAGLLPGNKIIAVNGLSVAGQELSEIISTIRGKQGEVVELTILAKNIQKVLSITRQPYRVENLRSQVLEDAKGNKAVYIKLSNFTENGLCKKFIDTIANDLRNTNTSRLIIDLRNNGGGLLSEVLCMAGAFYQEDGPLLQTWDLQKNKISEYYTYSFSANSVYPNGNPLLALRFPQVHNISSLLDGKPIVVLTNSSSASASEIFAGIVQDQKIGITVGERSFGKGTVQSPSNYQTTDGKNLVMFRTISRFHLPTGRTNQLSGISPDVEIYRTPNPTEEDKFQLRERELYSHAVVEAENNYVTPLAVKKTAAECLTNARIEEQYENLMSASDFADYQLLAAVELATCL